MSSVSVYLRSTARPRANATPFELLKARPTGTQSPHNALPWRRYTAQKYLAHLSATKAKTAQKIINYISYRYRLSEYTAQFTYAEIASHLGICTKTVQRYIHDLIAHRLLSLVRSGKSAPYSSTRANEAPIYTLLVPVGKNVHPLKTFKKSVKSLKDSNQKFSLTAVVESASDRWRATERLKEEVLDLRKVPTVLLVGHMRKIFAAGWCVKDVLVALEQSPEGEVYQSRGAGGMRSVLAWLHLRVNAWKGVDGVLPSSPTRVRREQVEVERERLVEQQREVVRELGRPRVVPVRGLEQVRLMREYLKVKGRYGVVEAARLYPEQAQLVGDRTTR